jgi:hypothetical protein
MRGIVAVRRPGIARMVKAYLTLSQILRLLCLGGQRNLSVVRSSMEMHMDTKVKLLARFSQTLLAVAATGATALVLQLAMVA